MNVSYSDNNQRESYNMDYLLSDEEEDKLFEDMVLNIIDKNEKDS